MKNYDEIVTLFERANGAFLEAEQSLFRSQVAEQTLCSALALHLKALVPQDKSLSGYHADVEYNRNMGSVKTVKKTIMDVDEQIISIKCDLILHSRGKCPEQDNLIALEMKKSKASRSKKQADRDRLMILTRDSFDGIWFSDGITLPEHVCGYVLGVYYEINYEQNLILIEYYRKGEMTNRYELQIAGND
jgi:hypothetical protein